MSEVLRLADWAGAASTPASTLVWIGPDSTESAGARATLAAWAQDAGVPAPAWAPTMTEASPALTGEQLLVVLDVTVETADWRGALNALRTAAPHAIAVAWAPSPDHPAAAQALLVDIDWVVTDLAPEPDTWVRAGLLGAARVTARRRNHGEAFRTFFAVMPMPAAVVDVTGRIVVSNASFVRAFGGAVAHHPILVLLDADALAQHGAAFRAVLAGAEDVHAAEFAVGEGESHQRHVLHLFHTRHEGSGTCFAVLQDAPARHEIVEAGEDREQHFRAVFEQAAVGITVVPALGGWVEINPTLQRMLGLPPRVTRERVMTCTHPEDRALDAVLFGELLQGRRSGYEIEKRYVNQDTGAVIDGIFSLTLERDAEGVPTTLIGTILDVTERRKAERARAESEARLRAFFEHAPVGLIVFDPVTGIGEANAAYQRFAGLPDATITLADMLALTHPEDRADDEALVAAVLAGNRTYGVRERRCSRPDGTEWWGRIVVTAARTSAGVPAALFVIREDVTERRETQAALIAARQAAEAATRAKSAFLANISHEIRTPMNGVVGMAQLLDTAPLDEEHRGYVATLLQCADHTLTLLNEVLEFSKLEADRVELEARPFDPRQIVEEAVGIVALQGAAKGLRLTTAIAPGVPRAVVGDAHRTRQVLLNYLSNAVKFTSAGMVSATVSATPRGDGGYDLQFAVRDTGIGIPTDRLDRLFLSFSQADASTTREYGGTGLGLAISKRLAELMGGRVWVESAPGVGSTFYASVRVGATTPASPAAVAAPPDILPLRVLVAEDNDVNRLVAVKLLDRLHIAPDVVRDGREAVEAAERAATEGRPYDLILMDIRMPVLDGIGATRAIRASLAPDQQPTIVAFTANALSEDREEYLAAGMQGHIAKPVQAAELARVVRAAAERAAALGGLTAVP